LRLSIEAAPSRSILPNKMLSSRLPAVALPYTERLLPSGLTMIHAAMPGADSVAVDVWVKAGASVESPQSLGIAHFLEHMIFKGTDRVPPGQFDYVVESHGGMTNAATGYDYAHYFIVTATAQIGEALPYLAELLCHAKIDGDEFISERQVVLEEMRQTWDDPDWVAYQALMGSVYQQHAYGRPILGTEVSLGAMTPADMREFHRAYYQPDNMTVVIVGDLDLAAAIELVETAFATFEGPVQRPIGPTIAEPPITTTRRQELRLPRLEQARLMLAWLCPGADCGWEYAAGLDLLAAVLTDGRRSRLVSELRETRGLVQDIEAGFSLQQDSGLFTLTAWLEPEHLNEVEAIIADRLTDLITTEVTAAELDRAQRILINSHAFATETPLQFAGLYGFYHHMGNLPAALTYPQQIQAVTAEELRNLASQFLSPQHYAVTIVEPGAVAS
jgi:zinc protease